MPEELSHRRGRAAVPRTASVTASASPQNRLQLVRFVCVGATGYVVNLACSRSASTCVGIDYQLAAVIAFVVSVVNNFWWNRHWTFDAKPGASGRAGAALLRRLAGRVRLHYVMLVALVDGAGMRRWSPRRSRSLRHPAVLHRAEALELPGLEPVPGRLGVRGPAAAPGSSPRCGPGAALGGRRCRDARWSPRTARRGRPRPSPRPPRWRTGTRRCSSPRRPSRRPATG